MRPELPEQVKYGDWLGGFVSQRCWTTVDRQSSVQRWRHAIVQIQEEEDCSEGEECVQRYRALPQKCDWETMPVHSYIRNSAKG